MKRLLVFAFSLLAATGLQAANPSFVDLVQTNILWVAKNGNNSTAKPGSPALKYASISNAVQAAVAPAVVKVAPGLYNESVILRDGVDLDMPSGVIVSQAVANLPVFFDNGVVSTNRLIGDFVVIQSATSGGSSYGFNITGVSSRTRVNRATIRQFSSVSGGFSKTRGELVFYGDIIASGDGISIGSLSENTTFIGTAISSNNYTCLIGGGASNYFSGTFLSFLNSSIHVSHGANNYTLIENADASSYNVDFGWGLEHSGGTVEARRSVFRSEVQEAIGKYGGDTMILDDVQLLSTNTLFSIDNDGDNTHGSIQIRGSCWANRPANPAMNITQGGVTVTNAFYFKEEQAYSSVHGITNAVLQTNGHTIFPKTIAAGTNTASFTFITTNLLTGQTYTNLAQRGHVVATISLTNVLAGDFSAMSLIVDQNGDGTWDDTNGPVSLQGVAALAGQQQLAGVLQPGALFAFTNQSAGTSPSATIRPGSCRWSRW